VRVLYGGNELFDYEVESTFWNDVWMAIYGVVTISILMLVMTSFSFTLTFMGLWCIVLAFPLAIFFYRVVFNIVGLGIMNGAAAFVIIGIGQLTDENNLFLKNKLFNCMPRETGEIR
jgi:PERQ amino acid-rich with GYF domain-containing protein